MATNNEPEVKIIERVEVAPAEDDELVEPEIETQTDSSQKKKNDDEGEPEATEEAEPELEETPESDTSDDEESEPAPQKNAAPEKYGEIKRLSNETPREFALRIENAKLRDEIRGKQSEGILTPPPVISTKRELSPEKQAILNKFKPEEMQAFREVLDVAAEEMGFVKKDELGATTYQAKATEVLDDFLEAHPEYQPQNDTNGTLWNAFRQEFQLYKPTQNPRDLKKILTKVHRDVFGIKPAASINKQDAAKEKVKVASHSGASKPSPSREGVKRSNAPVQGLRTDMLHGFSDEEIAEMTGE